MTSSSSTSSWASKNCSLFEKKGRTDWTSPSVPPESTFEKFPGLLGLTERQFDTLQYLQVEFPERERRVVDLSQSCDRAKIHRGRYSVVTPQCEAYVTDKCRLLTGTAKWRLGGHPAPPSPSRASRPSPMDPPTLSIHRVVVGSRGDRAGWGVSHQAARRDGRWAAVARRGRRTGQEDGPGGADDHPSG